MPHTDEKSRFPRVLLQLSREQCLDQGDLNRAYQVITEAVGAALRTQRTSIWTYNELKDRIVCVDLYEADKAAHSSGLELREKDFPSYFSYLKEERTLSAENAFTEPATREFSEVYLKPLNIFAMLDAPLRVHGQMIGIICAENIGATREWSAEEQSFIGSVTEIVARAIQAHERVKAQHALEEMNVKLEVLVQLRTKQLEEAHERNIYSARMASLGEMAAGVAHEINTPLGVIDMLAERMEMSLKEDRIDRNEMLRSVEKILTTTARMSKIINGLRMFARKGEWGDLEIVDLRDVIAEIINLSMQRFSAKNVQLKAMIPSKPIMVHCQPVQMGQVLTNLLNNAFDAVSANTNSWIELKIETDQANAIVKIVDSGEGIEEEIQKKLFQPFFTTKGPSRGTGLGLSISKGIMERHEGSVTYDAEAKNTTFVLKVKLASESSD